MTLIDRLQYLADSWPHESTVKVKTNEWAQPVGWCADYRGEFAIKCYRCELEDILKTEHARNAN